MAIDLKNLSSANLDWSTDQGNVDIDAANLPGLALTDVNAVANEAAQLALTAQEGDIAIRTDENKTYAHNGGSAGTMADWSELLTPTDSVTSVDGQTGVVDLSSTYAETGGANTFTGLQTFQGEIYAQSNVRMQNNATYIYNKLSNGTTWTRMMGVNASDIGYVGSIDQTLSTMQFINGTEILALTSAGNLTLNGDNVLTDANFVADTDYVAVGGGTFTGTVTFNSNTRQAGVNYIGYNATPGQVVLEGDATNSSAISMRSVGGTSHNVFRRNSTADTIIIGSSNNYGISFATGTSSFQKDGNDIYHAGNFVAGTDYQIPLTAGTDYVAVSGGTFSGDVSFGDGDSVYFGTGNDLRLHSDGLNSYIDGSNQNMFLRQTGASNLYIDNRGDSQLVLIRTDDSLGTTKNGIIVGGATPGVTLHYDGSASLRTDPNGAIIRGTTGTKDTDALSLLFIQDSAGTELARFGANSAVPANDILLRSNDGDINFQARRDTADSSNVNVQVDDATGTAFTAMSLRGSGTHELNGVLNLFTSGSLASGINLESNVDDSNSPRLFFTDNTGDSFCLMAANGNLQFRHSATPNASSGTIGATASNTGTWTFNNTVTVLGDVIIDDYIFHSADTDSYFGFDADDAWRMVLGNTPILDASSGNFTINNANLRVDDTSELIVENTTTGIGFLQMGNVNNGSTNDFVRANITMQRDENQITWDNTGGNWIHAGGSATDWSMIAHHSAHLSIYAGASDAVGWTKNQATLEADHLAIEISAATNPDVTVKNSLTVGDFIYVGDDDTTKGRLWLYGDNGPNGGSIRMFNGATEDTNSQYFDFEANGSYVNFLVDGSTMLRLGSNTAKTAGQFLVGNNATREGLIYLYGDDTNGGGQLLIYNGDTADTEIDYWRLIADTNGDLQITGEGGTNGGGTYLRIDATNGALYSTNGFVNDNASTTSTAKTLTPGETVMVDTAGQTVTLPASPTAGMEVRVCVGNFTNTVVARNGQNIVGAASDLTIDTANICVGLVFTNATDGWRTF